MILNINVFKSLIFITVYIMLFSCVNVTNKYKTESPNFIIFLVDDQGWNGTSVQMMNKEPLSKSDYHETPNLEILAQNGIKFSNAYSSAPVCAPSRYSIQFGKSPARMSLIRVGMNTDHIDHENWMSIPKMLKSVDNQYRTAHFGKWGMGSDLKNLGYDISDGPTKNKDGGFVNSSEQWETNMKENPKKIFSITHNALEFIENNVKDKSPFYLQISHYAVHSSLETTEHSFSHFDNKPKGVRHDNVGFAAMTHNLDSSLGLVMDKLSQLNIDDNTYIIYLSDNGSVPNIPAARPYEKSYNYPLSRGKWDALEGGVRVPFIIKGPGIEPNTQCDVPISGSDILPTIAEITGCSKQLNKIDGGSFLKILYGQDNVIKRSIPGIFFHVPYRNKIALNRPHSALRFDNFKLIRYNDNNEVKLYNLDNDLSEMKDLSKEKPDKTAELNEILEKYLISVKAPKWEEGITWKNQKIEEFDSTY